MKDLIYYSQFSSPLLQTVNQKKKGIFFLGIELASWLAFYQYKNKGDDYQKQYQEYGDEHWVGETHHGREAANITFLSEDMHTCSVLCRDICQVGKKLFRFWLVGNSNSSPHSTTIGIAPNVCEASA